MRLQRRDDREHASESGWCTPGGISPRIRRRSSATPNATCASLPCMATHAEDFGRRYGSWGIVVGASEGLGATFARELAARGMNLLLLARREALLAEVAEEIRKSHDREVRCLVADVADPALGERLVASIEIMKKAAAKRPPRVGPDDILPEYDFSRGRRSPYAARLAGAQIVVVDADLTSVFPDSAAVNEALRALAGLIRRKRPSTSTKPLTRQTLRTR